MLAVVKHAVKANFVLQQHSTSMQSAHDSSAAAVQNRELYFSCVMAPTTQS